MSKQNNNYLNDSNEEDKNIKIYEKDEAYMLGDNNSINNSNPNEEGELNENDLQENNQIIEKNENDLNPIQENITPENNQDETVRNQQNENNNNININNVNENNNYEAEEEEDQEQGNEEVENDGIPLITLNYISICQCCKNQFNSTINIPYLFKCGHFFCKKCIEEQFTDEEGIKCPNDGLIAYSIKELKLLNNLITDKYVESNTQREGLNNGFYCEIHKGQKLTHYIEETKELICVYCAFSRFKKNPKIGIKEIKEKCNEIINDIDSIIDDNQHNVEMIQGALKNIKKNKEIEDKRVNSFFEQIMNYLKNKKMEIMNQIDSLFTENARKLSQKLEIFSGKIEQSENLKNAIDEYNINGNINFLEILDIYNKLSKDSNDPNKINIQLQEYRFNHDDESKMIKYINNFGDLKVVSKNFAFSGGGEQEFVFNYNSNKINNVNISQQNELLNNSDFNNLSNNTFDYKSNISQNGREKVRLNNQIKNKNFPIKSVFQNDYKNDFMGQNNNFKPFNFNK